MRESDTYQIILEEGREEGSLQTMHRILLSQGREQFGEPSEADRRALLDIKDLARLDRMTVRLLRATSWQDLLHTP